MSRTVLAAIAVVGAVALIVGLAAVWTSRDSATADEVDFVTTDGARTQVEFGDALSRGEAELGRAIRLPAETPPDGTNATMVEVSAVKDGDIVTITRSTVVFHFAEDGAEPAPGERLLSLEFFEVTAVEIYPPAYPPEEADRLTALGEAIPGYQVYLERIENGHEVYTAIGDGHALYLRFELASGVTEDDAFEMLASALR